MREVCFIWEDDQGQVRVTHPVWKAQKPRESDDQFLERVVSKLKGKQVHAIHPKSLPKDRKDRRFWQIHDGKVVVAPKGEMGTDADPS
jgi:hypothetical protein